MPQLESDEIRRADERDEPIADPEAIKEALARDEAAAEAEPPDESNPPTEDDPEEEEAEQTPPEPEPEAAFTAEQGHELEKATTAYMKRVDKIFAGDVPWPTCPTCEGLGFDLTGGQGEPDWATASDKDECDECHGFGSVLSGSKVPELRTVRCERCKGAGYLVTRPVQIGNADQVAPVVVQLAEGNANGEQATALGPGDPGWEPWMGGAGEAAAQ